MDDNSLQINIEAVDDASSVLQGVADAAGSMAESLDGAATAANTALGSIGDTAATTGAAFSAVTDGAVAVDEAMGSIDSSIAGTETAFADLSSSVEGSVGSMEASLVTLNDMMATDSSTWSEDSLAMGTSFDDAAKMISTDALMADESMAAMLTAINAMVTSSGQAAENTGVNFTKIGVAMLAIGSVAKQIGGSMLGFYEDTIKHAQGAEVAYDAAKSNAQGLLTEMVGLKDPTSATSKEVATLEDKANLLRIQMSALEQPISGAGKTTEQLGLATARAHGEALKYRDQLNSLNDQIQKFTNLNDNAGMSAEQIANKFNDTARSNTSMGYTYSETMNSLATLEATTGSYKVALTANDAAIDVSLSKHISLEAASKAVGQAYMGTGKALKDLGIEVNNGAKGEDALKAVFEATGTALTEQQNSMQMSQAKLSAAWDLLLTDLGKTQGVLQPIINVVGELVGWVDKMVVQHPTLSRVVLITVGVFGALLTVLGGLLLALAPIVIAMGLLEGTFVATAAAAVLAAAVVALPFIAMGLAVVAVGVLFFVLTTEIIKHWDDIWNAIKTVGAGFKTVWNDVIDYVSDLFLGWYNKLMGWIDGIKNALANVGSSIKNGVSGAMSAVGHVIGVNDAIISPNGNVITTDPADYLIATKDPSSLLGGAGNSKVANSTPIIVNINGTVMSSEDQAKRLGDQIAKQLNRQFKLATY